MNESSGNFLQLNKFLGVLFVFAGQYLGSWSYLCQLMGLTQEFFFFQEFIKFLWMLFYVHHNLHGQVGNFSHLLVKVFRDPERWSGAESHPQKRRQLCFTLLYVSSGDFGLRC